MVGIQNCAEVRKIKDAERGMRDRAWGMWNAEIPIESSFPMERNFKNGKVDKWIL